MISTDAVTVFVVLGFFIPKGHSMIPGTRTPPSNKCRLPAVYGPADPGFIGPLSLENKIIKIFLVYLFARPWQ